MCTSKQSLWTPEERTPPTIYIQVLGSICKCEDKKLYYPFSACSDSCGKFEERVSIYDTQCQRGLDASVKSKEICLPHTSVNCSPWLWQCSRSATLFECNIHMYSWRGHWLNNESISIAISNNAISKTYRLQFRTRYIVWLSKGLICYCCVSSFTNPCYPPCMTLWWHLIVVMLYHVSDLLHSEYLAEAGFEKNIAD